MRAFDKDFLEECTLSSIFFTGTFRTALNACLQIWSTHIFSPLPYSPVSNSVYFYSA